MTFDNTFFAFGQSIRTYVLVPWMVVICFVSPGFTQSDIIDLKKLVKTNGMEVFNRTFTLFEEGARSGIRLSKDEGEGMAWIKGTQFSNGTIEFEVRGEDVKQRSFVGIVFHGVDSNTFDAVYLRPFNFRAQDELARNHGIQYISLPDYTWRKLRGEFPNLYEHVVEPALDPNAWIRVRVVIRDKTITTYLNGQQEPSLTVKKLTNVKSGLVGFYVADTSGGDFANLSITKSK